MTIFENYPPAEFAVQGLSVRFPVQAISEDFSNRIVEHERAFRNGAKLDDTGRKSRRWSVEAVFENSISEDGLEANGQALYPDAMNTLLELFDIHETGDLTLPTIGTIRARAASYKREERNDARDCAMVSLTFIEDNEDSVGASALELPTIQASAKVLAATSSFSAEEAGTFSANWSDLREFTAGLEGILTSPSSFVSDLDTNVGLTLAAADRVFDAAASNGDDPLNEPGGSLTQRKLEEIKDTASRSRRRYDEKPRRTPYLVSADTTIWAVASELGQDATELIKTNPNVNPSSIPQGTVLSVFSQ